MRHRSLSSFEKLRAKFYVLAGAILCFANATEACAKPGLSLDNYFQIRRVIELQLTADASHLVYVTCRCNLYNQEDNARQVVLQKTAIGSVPEIIPELQKGRAFAWSRSGNRLAYLSSQSGIAQIFEYDVVTRRVRQLTNAADPVLRFAVAPDGQTLAYTTAPTGKAGRAFAERLRNEKEGILVDTDYLSIYDFVDPASLGPYNSAPSGSTLWVAETGQTRRLQINGDIEAAGQAASMFWSPDSRRLSYTFVLNTVPDDDSRSRPTSVGLYDRASSEATTLATAAKSSGVPPLNYLGGEWAPSGKHILLRRWVEADSWVSRSHLELAHFSISGRELDGLKWMPVEVYNADWNHPVRFFTGWGDHVVTDNTYRAVQSLYELRPDREPKAIITLDGGNRLIGLAAGGIIAFVNESHTRPPEIFIGTTERGFRQLTKLNASIDASNIRWRSVAWRSRDGHEVTGWLIEPAVREGSSSLVTYIHGGPSEAYRNAFAPNFKNWPYPLELMAQSGIVVLIPNYRGTKTFGRSFSSPARLDGLPVDDIVTEIQAMVDREGIDRSRLGLLGHSHGAWLGPMVMTLLKTIPAAAFAEGFGNAGTTFELMPGLLNRNVHVATWNGSYYDIPQRYIELSPALHFKGLETVNLFEAGGHSGATLMMTYPKAATANKLATEFVVYPRTSHTVTEEVIARDAARRNLDWMRFWLQDVLPQDMDTAARWRQLRLDHCRTIGQRQPYCQRPLSP